jgi:hypothetical protein
MMTADRSFRLLVALAAAAVLVPLALAWRLLPCQDIAGPALHRVGAACRLQASPRRYQWESVWGSSSSQPPQPSLWPA